MRYPPDRSQESFEQVVNAMKEVHRAYPDMRFGQIVICVESLLGSTNNLFYVENLELAEFVRRFLSSKAGLQ